MTVQPSTGANIDGGLMIREDLNIIITTAFQPAMFVAYGIPDWNFEWRQHLGEDSRALGETEEFVELGQAEARNPPGLWP